VLSFEHVNFAINGKHSPKNYDNPNYYASFMIFQTYKNIIKKKMFTHLGASFDYVFTQRTKCGVYVKFNISKHFQPTTVKMICTLKLITLMEGPMICKG
jgi:hypothetical protein